MIKITSLGVVLFVTIFFAAHDIHCGASTEVQDHGNGKKDFSKYLGLRKENVEAFNKKPRKHVLKPKNKAIKKPHHERQRREIVIYDDNNFDWRNFSTCKSLRDIRSQQCDNCWKFLQASSAAAVMSDRHCLFTEENRFFSEAQTTTCASTDGGCHGGSSDKAFDYYPQNGIATGGDESVIPAEPLGCVPKSYLEGNSACPTMCTDGNVLDSSLGSEADYLRSAEYLNITMADRISKMKQEIFDYGPVVVYIQAYADFYNYTGGVYVHNPAVMCVNGTDWCGHVIRVIGWGIENNVPYWKAVNQWGTEWGDKDDPGTIKVKQGVTDKSGVDWFAAWAYPKAAYTVRTEANFQK